MPFGFTTARSCGHLRGVGHLPRRGEASGPAARPCQTWVSSVCIWAISAVCAEAILAARAFALGLEPLDRSVLALSTRRFRTTGDRQPSVLTMTYAE